MPQPLISLWAGWEEKLAGPEDGFVDTAVMLSSRKIVRFAPERQEPDARKGPMSGMLTPYGAFEHAIRGGARFLGIWRLFRFFKYPVVKNVETHILEGVPAEACVFEANNPGKRHG
jgi:hypothetical protein